MHENEQKPVPFRGNRSLGQQLMGLWVSVMSPMQHLRCQLYSLNLHRVARANDKVFQNENA